MTEPFTIRSLLAQGIPVVVCPRCQWFTMKPFGFESDKNLRVCLHCPDAPALDVVDPNRQPK